MDPTDRARLGFIRLGAAIPQLKPDEDDVLPEIPVLRHERESERVSPRRPVVTLASYERGPRDQWDS